MKFLSDLNKNETGIIKRIDANQELKYRFISFGIMKNNRIKVIETTPTKKTMQVEVDGTTIALRFDEAKKIEVVINE